MAPRKFVRVSMIIDHTKVYDFLELAENNALAGSFEIVPVRHGGEKESGELTPAPTPEKFVHDFLLQHGRIDTKDIIPLAVKEGLTRNAVYAQIKKLADGKILKRVDVGAYIPGKRSGRPPALAAPPTTKTKGKRKQAAHGEETAAERIVREIAARQQNGSGEGVSLSALKKIMSDEGYVSTGVGPALTLLVNKNRLVRVGKGMYRTAPEQAAAEPEQSPAPEASSTEG
jgi:hypothetical protein